MVLGLLLSVIAGFSDLRLPVAETVEWQGQYQPLANHHEDGPQIPDDEKEPPETSTEYLTVPLSLP